VRDSIGDDPHMIVGDRVTACSGELAAFASGLALA
jgi:hypothetical protein